jgi:hypothetical protein
MVLAINGQPVSSFNDVERMIAEVAAAAAAAAGRQGQEGQQQQQGGREEAPPAKRARVSGSDDSGAAAAVAAPAAGSEHAAEQGAGAAAAGAAGGAAQLPEVTLTIYRDATVQEVAVRWVPLPALAAGWVCQWNHALLVALRRPGIDLLSTTRLLCPPVALPAGWARRTAWAPTASCTGVARSSRWVQWKRWAVSPPLPCLDCATRQCALVTVAPQHAVAHPALPCPALCHSVPSHAPPARPPARLPAAVPPPRRARAGLPARAPRRLHQPLAPRQPLPPLRPVCPALCGR